MAKESDELKSVVFSDSAFLDKVKAQVRTSLITHFKLKSISCDTSVSKQLSNGLIADYLQWKKFNFTLSVFMPECGHRTDSRNALMDHFKIRELDGSVLDYLIDKYGSSFTDKSIQTETGLTISEKLQRVEEEFEMKGFKDNHSLLEERMFKYQQECDQRVTEEVEQKFRLFKETELEKMKAELELKYNLNLENEKKIILDDESKRITKLKETEEQLMFKFKKEKAEFEKDLHKQRSSLIEEYDKLKSREENLTKDFELQKKWLVMEEDRLRHEISKVVAERNSLENLKEQYAKRIQDEVQRYQLQFDKEHSELILNLKTEKVKFESDRALFAEKNKRLEILEEKIKELELELRNANATKTDLESTVSRQLKELETLRQNHNELKTNNEVLIGQLKANGLSMSSEIVQLKKQIVELERAALKKDQELSSAMNSINEANAVVKKLKKLASKFQKDSAFFKSKLESQVALNEEITKKLDSEFLIKKDLEREIADVRLLLHHTQSALQHDYRFANFKKVPDENYLPAKDRNTMEDRKSLNNALKIPAPQKILDLKNSKDDEWNRKELVDSVASEFLQKSNIKRFTEDSVKYDYKNDLDINPVEIDYLKLSTNEAVSKKDFFPKVRKEDDSNDFISGQKDEIFDENSVTSSLPVTNEENEKVSEFAKKSLVASNQTKLDEKSKPLPLLPSLSLISTKELTETSNDYDQIKQRDDEHALSLQSESKNHQYERKPSSISNPFSDKFQVSQISMVEETRKSLASLEKQSSAMTNPFSDKNELRDRERSQTMEDLEDQTELSLPTRDNTPSEPDDW